MGAVLLQEYDERQHPVWYASRKVLPREPGYSAIERECLAVIWATHVYLYGKKFAVETDHLPLLYFSCASQINASVLRRSCILSEYDFSVRYIPRAGNVGADYLSRLQRGQEAVIIRRTTLCQYFCAFLVFLGLLINRYVL